VWLEACAIDYTMLGRRLVSYLDRFGVLSPLEGPFPILNCKVSYGIISYQMRCGDVGWRVFFMV